MEPSPDVTLGPYKLIARIGAGGMGEVWKAEDTRLGRIVAIKVLPKALAEDPESRARLQREARTAAHLYHPNIATIHSIEQDGDRMFIVMQYVDGEALSKVIERGGLSEAEITQIGKGIADALAEAHSHGVVHRDIKPDNVIVSAGRVKVLDFGIAKQVGPEAMNADGPTAFMTKQGMIIGTVQYMSPEQALGRQLDFRTDIFSLGVVLYQAVTGKLPFQGESITETITQIIRDEPVPTAKANPQISAGLAAIVDRCLRKNKEERFDSAAELAAALDRQFGAAATAPASVPAAVSSAGTAVSSNPGGSRDGKASAAAAPTLVTDTSELRNRRPRWGLPLALALLVALAATGTWFFTRRPGVGATRAEAAPRTVPAQPAGSTMSVSPAPATSAPSGNGDGAPHKDAASDGGSSIGSSGTPADSGDVTTSRSKVAENAGSDPREAEGSAVHAPRSAGRDDARSSATDSLYNRAVEILAGGHLPAARRMLETVIGNDPHYAAAHLRIGEIMLLNQNTAGAGDQFKLALGDSDRLTPRDQALAAIGAAAASDDLPAARSLAKDFAAEHPDDAELRLLRRAIGEEAREQRGQEPHRGMGKRRRRPQ